MSSRTIQYQEKSWSRTSFCFLESSEFPDCKTMHGLAHCPKCNTWALTYKSHKCDCGETKMRSVDETTYHAVSNAVIKDNYDWSHSEKVKNMLHSRR